jgi:cold-inducible RNA-binding protein
MSNSKLYVGNLSFKTTEDELRSTFGQFGSVTDVYVAMDKMTGRPRGFAFVTMGTAEEAKVAAEKMNGVDLGGRQLTVNEARPKEDRPAGGFGGGGRGFGGDGVGRGFGGGGGGGYGGGGGRDRGERRY